MNRYQRCRKHHFMVAASCFSATIISAACVYGFAVLHSPTLAVLAALSTVVNGWLGLANAGLARRFNHADKATRHYPL